MENTEDLEAKYSIGEPMTFDEMVKLRKNDQEFTVHNPFETSQENNPYVFEDKPVGIRRYVIANFVGDGFQQKHKHNKCMMKIKTSTVTSNQAINMCDSIKQKDPKYALYVLEMFKFICIPQPNYNCDVDSEMNEAIRMEYSSIQDNRNDFVKRKQTMLNEVERHNDIKRKVARGEIDESQIESNPICPETMNKPDDTENTFTEEMEPDAPLCNDKFVVIASLQISKYEKLKNSLIIKICGTFDNESDATSHMKKIKKNTKYTLFDVSVCDMYAWLEMPPPYELIENVMFDSEKLTQSIGTRRNTINIDSSDLQCPADYLT